jgi:hypothetical protein
VNVESGPEVNESPQSIGTTRDGGSNLTAQERSAPVFLFAAHLFFVILVGVAVAFGLKGPDPAWVSQEALNVVTETAESLCKAMQRDMVCLKPTILGKRRWIRSHRVAFQTPMAEQRLNEILLNDGWKRSERTRLYRSAYCRGGLEVLLNQENAGWILTVAIAADRSSCTTGGQSQAP